MNKNSTASRPASKAVNELLEMTSPAEWKDWLNEIQAALIAAGHCESMTRKGSSEFAANFLQLQRFFSELQN